MNNERVIKALKCSNTWEEYDICMGRLCGIPECCIKFFIGLDKAGCKAGSVADQLYGKVTKEPLDATGGFYVLCPKCRRLRTVKRIPYKKTERNARRDFSEFKDLHRRFL